MSYVLRALEQENRNIDERIAHLLAEKAKNEEALRVLKGEEAKRPKWDSLSEENKALFMAAAEESPIVSAYVKFRDEFLPVSFDNWKQNVWDKQHATS